jgi:hypothetical protein
MVGCNGLCISFYLILAIFRMHLAISHHSRWDILRGKRATISGDAAASRLFNIHEPTTHATSATCMRLTPKRQLCLFPATAMALGWCVAARQANTTPTEPCIMAPPISAPDGAAVIIQTAEK